MTIIFIVFIILTVLSIPVHILYQKINKRSTTLSILWLSLLLVEYGWCIIYLFNIKQLLIGLEVIYGTLIILFTFAVYIVKINQKGVKEKR